MNDGFIIKEVIAEVPVKVVYSITKKGAQSVPIIVSLREYGFQLMEEDGIKVG